MTSRVYVDAGEHTEKVHALLGALGYQVVRRFVRRGGSVDAQIDKLERRLAASDRDTLHAMLVTDDAGGHARLLGIAEAKAKRREEWVLFKLGARSRLDLLRRIAGLDPVRRCCRGL